MAPIDTQLAGRMADAIRMLAVDAVQQANSGHPGAPMGMAGMATVRWTRQFGFSAGAVMAALRQRVAVASRTA